MSDHTHEYICLICYGERVPPARARIQLKNKERLSCLSCGDKVAKATVRTIAPMHKSNYMLFTNMDDLKGINNKGGLIK